MENTKNTTTAARFTTAQNGYEVTKEMTQLFDCLRASADLYSLIIDTLAQLHVVAGCEFVNGRDYADTLAEPYLQHINAIDDMLHREITERVIDSLSDTTNTHNTDRVQI